MPRALSTCLLDVSSHFAYVSYLQHFILAVQFGIASVIPDVPGFVEEHLKRQVRLCFVSSLCCSVPPFRRMLPQSYLVEKHVDGVEDEVDNFAEEEEEEDDKSVASNKGGHLPANFQLHFHELIPAEDEEGKKEEPPLAPASSARAPVAVIPAAAPPAVKGNPPESLTQRLLDQAEPL